MTGIRFADRIFFIFICVAALSGGMEFFMNLKLKIIHILQLLTIILLNVLMVTIVSSSAQNSAYTLSQQGSQGTEVKQIQTRLKSWGYYKGALDGIFGSATKKAVQYFQRKNGLSADGVAGSATLAALGLPSKSGGGSYGKYSKNDYYLLARIISAEARGEPFVGQVAVGAVILNRIENPAFPDTIPGVIYQPGAFTCITDGQFNTPVASSAYRAAQNAMNGWDPSNGAVYYYNPKTAISQWIRKRPILLRIGNHVFCK